LLLRNVTDIVAPSASIDVKAAANAHVITMKNQTKTAPDPGRRFRAQKICSNLEKAGGKGKWHALRWSPAARGVSGRPLALHCNKPDGR
jgi:hypothetical protein